MTQQEMDIQKLEGEPLSTNPEISPNQISFETADKTFNDLMFKFTKDEKFQPVTEEERLVLDKESPLLPEKIKTGKVRGALIPLAASGAGIGANYLFNSNAYKIGQAASEITGAVSPVFETLSVLEKFSPPLIATVGAGIGSLTASAIRRNMGENVFEYYSRYSHLDADGNFVTKPLKKALNWVTRGPEHLAFNTLIMNPAEPEKKVRELIEIGNAENLEPIKEMSKNIVEGLTAKGYLHLVSAEATDYFGAEFNDEERQQIDEYKSQVQNAINNVKSTIPAERRAEFEKSVFERVVNEEKIRYGLATGTMASVSALKAFAFGSVFEAIQDFVIPKFFPASPAMQPQTAEAPAEVPVTQPAGVPEVNLADVSNTVPENVPDMAPSGVPTADILRPGNYDPSVPVSDILRPGNFNPAAEAVNAINIPEVANTAPQLEVTGVADAIDTLPTISATGVMEGAGTAESLITMEEGIGMLNQSLEENPDAIVQAWQYIHNDLPTDLKDGLAPISASAPEIIAGINSAGPATIYIINKVLQAMACAGSIPSGGMACPVLAGP